MAIPKPHIYRVSKSHAVASKMKPGESMTSRMKMMPPADDDGDEYQFQEEEAAPYTAPAPKKKAKTPAEAIRMKRQSPVT